MTGEITLTGQVLPIGGLKEKALAAQRNGVRTVIAPALNEADAEDIPEHLRKRLRFVWVAEIDDVLDAALQSACVTNHGRRVCSAQSPTPTQRGKLHGQEERRRPPPSAPSRRPARTPTSSASSRTRSCATTSGSPSRPRATPTSA